ncbi:hypothetical protein SAMN05421882_106211 [Nitrosomonas communis]|uniref:Uncharacterized protein n=1 Tax=Nitrosomonas communis TaxID=44574 RepID=A0A1H2Z0K4_9PROT|nr:hypothetical protein SAMN05421882_106211 [Nitrosomonas communis]
MPLGIASVIIPFPTVIVSLLPTPYNETHLEMLARYPRQLDKHLIDQYSVSQDLTTILPCAQFSCWFTLNQN